MRYLVGTDGSRESDDAVRYAAAHAVAFDATLEVVHVLTPETELIDGEVVLPGEEAAIDVGEATLDRAVELALEVAADAATTRTGAVTDGGDASVDVIAQLLTGRPADAITRRAEEADAEAIFVGHRGLSSERERVVGSVAKSVLDRASVPVTVIR